MHIRVNSLVIIAPLPVVTLSTQSSVSSGWCYCSDLVPIMAMLSQQHTVTTWKVYERKEEEEERDLE